jgi:hypothetical protein
MIFIRETPFGWVERLSYFSHASRAAIYFKLKVSGEQTAQPDYEASVKQGGLGRAGVARAY